MKPDDEAAIVAVADLGLRMGAEDFRIGWLRDSAIDPGWWCMTTHPPLSNVISSGRPGYILHEEKIIYPTDIDISELDDEGCPTDQAGRGCQTPWEAADGFAALILEGGGCVKCERPITVGSKRKTGGPVCVHYRKGAKWMKSCG